METKTRWIVLKGKYEVALYSSSEQLLGTAKVNIRV